MMNMDESNLAPSAPMLRLEFKWAGGKILIDSSNNTDDLFALSHLEDSGHVQPLGTYRSINDAILIVLRQETGLARWDRLTPEELPRQVHDIASWKFSELLKNAF